MEFLEDKMNMFVHAIELSVSLQFPGVNIPTPKPPTPLGDLIAREFAKVSRVPGVCGL